MKIGEIRENSLTFAPNILYIIEKETCPGYISEVNSNWLKQIIPLLVPYEEKEGWLSKHTTMIFFLFCFNIFYNQKTNINLVKKYIKRNLFVNCFDIWKEQYIRI